MDTNRALHTPPKEFLYPESDGKPVAETEVHFRILTHLVHALRLWYAAEAQVYVAGNLLMYYVEGDSNIRVAPDVFVAKGVLKRVRRVYKVWEEGKGPDVVVEVSSRGTKGEDLGPKLELYRDVLGVKEYYVYDPLREYVPQRMRAWWRREGRWEERSVTGAEMVSAELGLVLVDRDGDLRLKNPRTGRLLPTLEESDAERVRAEAERARAEAARAVEEEARRAAEERARLAEEESRRLREELARLRGPGFGMGSTSET